ncbi:AidA/PixA family protein [Flavobacterium collinsii]|uniref:Uncharacterized protein n=1 Tax=Flavobacterium collinsii TaxID=1114861 RepID=A0ABM8KMW8_9FLAO|nr:AidA/PixA family protein [Flavobacterium collinsii]CAA9201530.1 hypothetical protein FLACOL7796_03808 [Flavobacterium collinsii]
MSNTNTISINDVLRGAVELATNDQLPLEVVFQQCYDNEHLSPENNFGAWDLCLQQVYNTRNPKPGIEEFGDAMYSVWKNAGLSRAIMIKALESIPGYTGAPIYTEVNKYYPITVLMTVDTIKTVQTGSLYITITDDNGDPNQGSSEIQVNAKISTIIRWKAVSLNVTDTVHLKQFVVRGGVNLFSANEPSLQSDGTFQGTLITTGTEVYSFTITINDGSQQYDWDPYIVCTA